MTATIDNNFEYLDMYFDNSTEKEDIGIKFNNVKVRDWRFKKKKNSHWDGSVNFIKFGNKIPIGMWDELRKYCMKRNFTFRITNMSKLVDITINLDTIQKFAEGLLKHNPEFDPNNRPEQIDAVFRALKYGRCILNLSTSLGKTLIIYLLVMYLLYTKSAKRILIVCPDADLILQMASDFEKYSKGKYKIPTCLVHGGTKEYTTEGYNIVIGNFQTLSNRNPEFFDGIDGIILDEAHRASSSSYNYIFNSCKKTKYRIGLTGSIQIDHSADAYRLLSNMGPVVQQVKKREAIDKGYATNIKIRTYVLDYAPVEQRESLAMFKIRTQDGEKTMRMEQDFVRNSQMRLKWLTELMLKIMDSNILVLFHDIKDSYGKKIVAELRKNSNREVFYIDGEVKKEIREIYIDRLENGVNKILVASFNTFSTGKSVKNLHYAVLAESVKGFVPIQQALGRLMRLHDSKENAVWVDIVDDFSIHNAIYDYTGYGIKHMHERQKQFEKDSFENVIHSVTINNNALF